MERTQINKIRSERGEITTDTTEIQRIVRNYYEELYAKKFENLGEMDIFLEKYNLPKLNEEEAENMNRQITPDKIEAVIKKLPTNKAQSKQKGGNNQDQGRMKYIGTERTIQSIDKSRNRSFVKGKLNQQAFKQIQQEKERTKINKIRNERREIAANTTEIQRIVRNY